MCTRVPFSFHSKSFFGNTSARGSQSASACGSVHNSSIPRATCLDRGRSGPAGNMRAHPQSTVGLRCMSGTGTVNLSYACSYTHRERDRERQTKRVSHICSLSLSLTHPDSITQIQEGRKEIIPTGNLPHDTRFCGVAVYQLSSSHVFSPAAPTLSFTICFAQHTHNGTFSTHAEGARNLFPPHTFGLILLLRRHDRRYSRSVHISHTLCYDCSKYVTIHTHTHSLSLSHSHSLSLSSHRLSSSSSCGYSRCAHRHAI